MKHTIRLAMYLLLLLCILTSCSGQRMYDYYAESGNYIQTSGLVSYVSYNEDGSALYIGFSNLDPCFSDNTFKIVGENLSVVQQNGIDGKLEIGETVLFTSAPKYFGDAYVMPIVAISIDGEELLSFDVGYTNLMHWLK